ncbi:uncharacterized protein KQ657_003460 [Scheffersomyces spartinae]|uniref:SCD domain-containing protein n=1 Tax=Scheffersomyces spartinae TaxID=45513 RepID=A0A9P7V596_9ASCO|nr:uncharacterized protein KQ657_003460 [Scheffersomyces spartinae]KAG7191416.1 hypothetical protein KQ657_003460 [Scheffersomyces spartinae]
MVVSVRRSSRTANKAVSYLEADSDDDEDVIVDEMLHVTSDNDNNEDEEDGQEDDDDDEDDDDEYLEIRKRPRGRKAATKESASKRRRKSPTLEERELNLKENTYYIQLASPEVDINELALSWLSAFEDDPNTAMADILNLVLRSGGSLYLFTPKEMDDLDSSTDVIDKLVGKFSGQGKHKYPFKLIPIFRNNVIELFNQIIVTGHENGMLYQYDEGENDDDKYSPMMESLLIWISGLNSCTVRPLRCISTTILLRILTRLSIIINNVIDSLEKAQKQLSKIKKTQKAKAKAISQAIKTSQRQKDAITLYLKDIVSACLVHRYRDIDDSIRHECIKLLGECMLEYPDFFLQPVYLRYFGWLLADPSGNVKAELTRMLLKIYKKFSQGQMTITNGVSQFTQRYKLQLIKTSLLDGDLTVRIHATSICCELLKIGFLNEQDNLMIVSGLLYIIDGGKSIYLSPSNVEKLKNEVCKFISIWNEEQATIKLEKYSTIIENYNSEEFENDPDSTGISEDGKISLQSCIKYSELIRILRQSMEYYFSEEPDSSIETKFPIATIFTMLQKLPLYQGSWEFLINYLLLDTSKIVFTTSSTTYEADSSQLEELTTSLDLHDETDKTYLFSCAHGLLIHFLQGKFKARDKEDATKNVIKMVQYLSKLQKFLMVSEARVQIFVNIWNLGLSNPDPDFNFYLMYKSLDNLEEYNEISESLLRYYYIFENGAMESSNIIIQEFNKYFFIILENYDNNSISAVINTLTPSLRISIQDLVKDLMYGISNLLENPQEPTTTIENDDEELDDEKMLQRQLISMLEDILSPLLKLQSILNHAAFEEVLEQRDPSVSTLLTFNVLFKIDFIAMFGRLHDEFMPISISFSKWLGVALEFNITFLSWQLEKTFDKLSSIESKELSNLTRDEVRNIADTQRAMIKRLTTLLEDLEIVMERINDSIEDETDASNSLEAAFKLKEVISVRLMDVLSLLKVFYLRAKDLQSSVVNILDNNEIHKYIQGYLPIETQRSILSVALYHEYKISKINNIDLDRSIEEGILFYDLIIVPVPQFSEEQFENEKNETVRREKSRAKQIEVRKRKSDLQWECEQEFCVYIFHIFKLMKLSMLNDFVFQRLKLNSEKLGSVYHKIITLKNEELKKMASNTEVSLTSNEEMETSYPVDAVAS